MRLTITILVLVGTVSAGALGEENQGNRKGWQNVDWKSVDWQHQNWAGFADGLKQFANGQTGKQSPGQNQDWQKWQKKYGSGEQGQGNNGQNQPWRGQVNQYEPLEKIVWQNSIFQNTIWQNQGVQGQFNQRQGQQQFGNGVGQNENSPSGDWVSRGDRNPLNDPWYKEQVRRYFEELKKQRREKENWEKQIRILQEQINQQNRNKPWGSEGKSKPWDRRG